MELRPGERIGNYRLEAELGPTGAGVLYVGRHLVLPRQAIVKVVHPSFASLRPYALQTLREACILEAIAHPGVPVVYESGVLSDRRPWFAFEHITGPTLAELLAPGALALLEVVGLLRDLVDILAGAHRRGVIHRGLRPERIVVTAGRQFPLCVPDWSEAIAHDAAADAHPVSPDESGVYRAPELVDRLAGVAHVLVDDRADMYSLGVIAYRALTGRLPFGDDDAPPVPAHVLRPDAPPELAALVDSLISHDRFDRPSASEVCAELDWLFDALPMLRPTARDLVAPRARATTEPSPPTSPRASADGTGPVAAPPRLRRPRWTPEVRYLDVTPVEIELELGDDDRSHER